MWALGYFFEAAGIEIRGRTAAGRAAVLVLGMKSEIRQMVRYELWGDAQNVLAGASTEIGGGIQIDRAREVVMLPVNAPVERSYSSAPAVGGYGQAPAVSTLP